MPQRNRMFRNPVARSPLLRKGGVHIQSKTGQRTRDRITTSSAIDEWRDEMKENLIDRPPKNLGSNNDGCYSPLIRDRATNNTPGDCV